MCHTVLSCAALCMLLTRASSAVAPRVLRRAAARRGAASGCPLVERPHCWPTTPAHIYCLQGNMDSGVLFGSKEMIEQRWVASSWFGCAAPAAVTAAGTAAALSAAAAAAHRLMRCGGAARGRTWTAVPKACTYQCLLLNLT